jgi:SOS-response transcriptional repressor LexA
MHRGVPINGRRFADLRRSLRLTQDELAARLHMTGGNVARIESCDVTGINVRNFRRLAELVGIDAEELESRICPAPSAARPHRPTRRAKSPARQTAAATSHRQPSELSAVPLLGEVVAGGLVESRVYDPDNTERLPMAFPGQERVYALRISGDSMSPAYQPGEILIVQDLTPDELIDGEDAVIQRDGSGDDTSTFKRVVFVGNGRLKLVPLNAAYPPIECPLDSVVRIGRVLGKYTPVQPPNQSPSR